MTREDVLIAHRWSLAFYGGSAGILSDNMLESALHAPQASMGGEFLYQSLEEMAATYFFSFTCNHAFNDGNKRVGLLICEMFLAFNGYELRLSDEEAEDVALRVADRRITKDQLTDLIRSAMSPRMS